MKILFTKSSKRRKKKFQLETSLIIRKKKVLVRRKAISNEAKPHLHRMIDTIDRLTKLNMKVNFESVFNSTDEFIDFVYLPHLTFEKKIEDALLNSDWDQAESILKRYKSVIKMLSVHKKNPYASRGFIELFDPELLFDFNKKEQCIADGLFDLNTDNILDTSTPTVIDLEWTQDFPIPLNYIFFRSLISLSGKFSHLLLTYSKTNQDFYKISDLLNIPVKWFNIFGLDASDIRKWIYYEENFQNSIHFRQSETSLTMSIELAKNTSFFEADRRFNNKYQLDDFNMLKEENRQLSSNLEVLKQSKAFKMQSYINRVKQIFRK